MSDVTMGEPVAWLDLRKLSVGGMTYATSTKANSRQVPLYTTPPSVEALIAELMELHLTYQDYLDIKEVCNKYRSEQ